MSHTSNVFSMNHFIREILDWFLFSLSVGDESISCSHDRIFLFKVKQCVVCLKYNNVSVLNWSLIFEVKTLHLKEVVGGTEVIIVRFNSNNHDNTLSLRLGTIIFKTTILFFFCLIYFLCVVIISLKENIFWYF